MRFLTDENVSPCLAFILTEWGHDGQSAKLRGDLRNQPDAEVMRKAVAEQRVVITFNTQDYEGLHEKLIADGSHHPGIVVCTQMGYEGFERLLSWMRKMLSILGPDEFADRVHYLHTY